MVLLVPEAKEAFRERIRKAWRGSLGREQGENLTVCCGEGVVCSLPLALLSPKSLEGLVTRLEEGDGARLHIDLQEAQGDLELAYRIITGLPPLSALM
jgi:hypothetical protein